MTLSIRVCLVFSIPVKILMHIFPVEPYSFGASLTINFKGLLVLISKYEPGHEISNNVVCATSKGSDQPAHTRSLIRAFASRLSIL